MSMGGEAQQFACLIYQLVQCPSHRIIFKAEHNISLVLVCCLKQTSFVFMDIYIDNIFLNDYYCVD